MGHYYDIYINGKEVECFKSWSWYEAFHDALNQANGRNAGAIPLGGKFTIRIDGESDADEYEITITRKR